MLRYWIGRLAFAGILAALAWVMWGEAAGAQAFGSRTLSRGARGPDVLELQIRTAGWYDNCVAGVSCRTHFHLDGVFGPKTQRAVRNFQKAYGARIDGVAGPETFGKARALADADGSTRSFDYGHFTEKSAACQTNNQGTFNGGFVPASAVKENVRRLMYRLEVVRHKGDGRNAYITSGFRSVAYQECLRSRNGSGSVAKRSQHSYGAAADSVMSGVSLGRLRGLAKTSQMHAILCYDSDRHNHLDIRLDNSSFNGGGKFVWPRTDSAGRDLDSTGRRCHGGQGSPPTTGGKPPAAGVVDPWEFVADPTAPTDAEGLALQNSSEEVFLRRDLDNLAEVTGSLCECVPELHDDEG